MMVKKIKVGLGLLGALGLSSCRSYKGAVSDHFDGELFYNPWEKQDHSFGSVLKWKFTETAQKWPQSVANNPNPTIPSAYQTGDVSITFINHASFLIQVGGLNILTDPVLSDRVSPVSWAGPRRVREPGLSFEQLPKIDSVLVSHNHYDHLDLPTLQKLSAKFQPKIFVPLGDRDWLLDESVAKVEQMDWWQSIALSSEVTIHFAPAQHWSSRSLSDRNKSLWGAYLIEYKGKMIYFAGDTGYGPHFSSAAERFPHIEVALLPIGAYEPRWFMKYAHMNPEDAIRAFQDLKAGKALGMHFGTWQLTDEGIDDPVTELKNQMRSAPYAAAKLEDIFLVPEVGGTYRYRF